MDHTIVHFEIPAKDVNKLMKFYGDLFGWKISKAMDEASGGMDYYLIQTVPVDDKMMPLRPGVNGGMFKKTERDAKPVNYFSVESADDFIARIKKLGGKIIVPKQEVQGVGWTAIAADPEGNYFAIMQPMMNPPNSK